jgi:tetratricopeptide (TPR) repeat protein
MKEVALAHPNDDDIQVIYAESLMDVNPWKLWTLDGKAAPGTAEAVATLERVMARSPNHPGANHYYIHVVEASNAPERATAAADRLPGLMPGAGHLVHMPAHIYQRLGRYEDASEANRRAVKADEAYFQKTRPPGYYPMYLGHNHGFLAYSASMEGRAKESLAAAREAVKAIPPEMLEMMPGMDFFAAEQLLVMVRFGMWGAILEEPRPPEKYQTLSALWLHARGMALASTGKLDQARAVGQALRALAAAMPPDLQAGMNPARNVAALGLQAIEARIAERSGQRPEAIAAWRRAVALEDGMAYNEPADWFYPMRHYLGATLLDAKRAKDAEQVFRDDLRRNPGNGWALFGLSQALTAQKSKAAAKARQDFQAAWTRADTQLKRAAF